MKIKVIALIGFLSAAGVAAERPAAEASLSGRWQGSYSMLGHDGKYRTVPFTAQLTQDGRRLTGSTVEPNRLDENPTDPELTATLSGIREGGRAAFQKKYGGQGGKTHTVEYEGLYEEDRDRITGRWAVGDVMGAFTMTRGR